MNRYKINKNLGFVKLPFNLTSDFDDSMEEARKSSIVRDALSNEIQEINDYEISVYKPHQPRIIFDLFFHRTINTVTNADIRTMLSSSYIDYYDQMKDYFYNFVNYADLEFYGNDLPRHITEYPTFWNSFGYPFYTNKESWYRPLPNGNPSNILLPTRFDPQSYLYNSFIKMNFYTSPYSIDQELLFQNVVYVNPRWCQMEGDVNGSWHRPTFWLDDACDGYFLHWLNEYDIDTFYVSFQFWDALNGRMINLLPSHPSDKDRHWVQSVNEGFDSRMLYMEYKLNYGSKNYTMRTFDSAGKSWQKRTFIVYLYELIFNDFFARANPNIIVRNGIEAPVVVEPTAQQTNFSIDIDPEVSDIPPKTAEFGVEYKSGFNFDTLRNKWSEATVFVVETYTDTVKITNTGTDDIYLKNIEIELVEAASSTVKRITGLRKDVRINPITSVRSSTYTLSSVPNYNIYQGHGLQTDFDKYYKPERLIKPTSPSENDYAVKMRNYKNTVAYNPSDKGRQNWWESVVWMSWFYPISVANFDYNAPKFSEQLYITHEGDDLRGIAPNETLNLNLNWGFGENYGYVYVEPLFYKLCDNPQTVPSKNYVVDLKYNVKLYFNNLRNSLPETSNMKTFTVKSYFKFSYKAYTSSGGRHSE